MSATIAPWLTVALLVLALAGGARAQEAPAQQPPSPGTAPQPAAPGPQKPRPGMMKPGDMQARCQQAMADREKIMAEMKAADGRLDELVAKMKAASGQEKIDATAAVVSELVAQRRTNRDRMTQMHQGMMRHMMEHGQAGRGMAECPMMKMGSGGMMR